MYWVFIGNQVRFLSYGAKRDSLTCRIPCHGAIVDYFAQVDWLSMLLSEAAFGDLGDSDNS